MKKYYSLVQMGQEANINIYGDITSWPWSESDVSSYNLSKQLAEMENVSQINVYINSYGGEVAEGLAIYNALKRHKAKVTTYCDGFAASIASVIFMAGDERIMNEASLLMIHNAWTSASGNAAALRKQADDLEKISQASVEAYKATSSLSEEEIKELMDNESWILPSEAVEYGFATSIETNEVNNTSQNAKMQLFDIVKKYQEQQAKEEQPKEEKVPEEEETKEEETKEEETEEDSEEKGEEPKNSKAEAAQKWSGFFNAILKI